MEILKHVKWASGFSEDGSPWLSTGLLIADRYFVPPIIIEVTLTGFDHPRVNAVEMLALTHVLAAAINYRDVRWGLRARQHNKPSNPNPK